MSSNDSTLDTIIAQIAELSFADKLVLNERIATALRKEGKSGKIGKAAKPKDAKDKPKRDVAVGTLAWIAFVKHCKTEFADRFADIKLEKERLAVAKAIREEDKDAYDTFVSNYKAEHGSASNDDADGEDAPSSPVVTAPAPKVTAPAMKDKVAALKAKAAASSAPKTAAVTKSSPAPAPVVSATAKKPVKAAAPKKDAAKVTSPKATSKKAAPAPKVDEPVGDDDAMPTKTIDGVTYFFDADTNGLWMREDDGGFGAWVGYAEDDGIRFTDGPDA